MSKAQSRPIIVLGAGSWGSALALVLARNGKDVRLWGHKASHMLQLKQKRENVCHLPGHIFPSSLSLHTDLSEVLSGNLLDILMVVPSHAFLMLLEKIRPLLSSKPRILWGTKGIEPHTHQLPGDCVRTVLGEVPMAAISGPSFAKEVAAQLPTAMGIASNSDLLLQDSIQWFHTDFLRLYTSYDLVGFQICSVVKNVLAIASGLSDGMELGANARSALIARGLGEMERLCSAIGGDKDTVYGLAGLGDLVLTCTSHLSRNQRLGVALGRGQTIEQAKHIIGQSIEGLNNAIEIYQMAQCYQVDMPICRQVYRIIQGEIAVKRALMELMQRSPSAAIGTPVSLKENILKRDVD